MAGHGGYKHRKIALKQKRTQARNKAHENVAKVRAGFEAKGQPWDPKNNPAQMAALSHVARRLVGASEARNH